MNGSRYLYDPLPAAGARRELTGYHVSMLAGGTARRRQYRPTPRAYRTVLPAGKLSQAGRNGGAATLPAGELEQAGTAAGQHDEK